MPSNLQAAIDSFLLRHRRTRLTYAEACQIARELCIPRAVILRDVRVMEDSYETRSPHDAMSCLPQSEGAYQPQSESEPVSFVEAVNDRHAVPQMPTYLSSMLVPGAET